MNEKIEVFMKIRKKKIFWGVRGVGLGGGRVGRDQCGCERRIDVL